MRFLESVCPITAIIDLWLEDFLEEISERRPPDEHAMGPGHDGADVLDLQCT
jgi:hypothetical protein